MYSRLLDCFGALPLATTVTPGGAMLDDFLTRAALAGIGTAILAAPLGCFVVWRRMAYFGETVAYSGLLGVALGFLLGIDLTLGVIATAVAMALLLTAFQAQRKIPYDTLLGILAHTALAAGLIAASFVGGARLDLMGYLFGDILAVSKTDLAWIWGGRDCRSCRAVLAVAAASGHDGERGSSPQPRACPCGGRVRRSSF